MQPRNYFLSFMIMMPNNSESMGWSWLEKVLWSLPVSVMLLIKWMEEFRSCYFFQRFIHWYHLNPPWDLLAISAWGHTSLVCTWLFPCFFQLCFKWICVYLNWFFLRPFCYIDAIVNFRSFTSQGMMGLTLLMYFEYACKF